MAHNPHAPQGPQGGNDPAGSTQMFRAFVEEGEQRAPQAARGGWSTGKKVAVIGGIVVLVLAFAVLSLPNQPWTIF
ncbi:hypothetical protein QIS99_21060 [Streptomyces sp. B-S-A8]|uniref:Uncharacterized protein n=1 Tax=Streptomyces solicavernae TaxID=3043614 RepID=A0ABT6RWB5_9ACTN|nr:hypothetical protein [Streptomyces sp. B-S-A8]MDI3388675.1 hypothetical protein [Streptomyces sp. B-S-A8]